MGWKRIEPQHSNATTSVTLRDLEGGAEQTTVSNRIHPCFVQTTRAVPASSEGRVDTGDLPGGHWIDAAHLHPGDRLPTDDATWAEVVAVGVEARPLTAYNLTVADFHTYFVAANTNAAPVWVHNNCWDVPPPGAVQQTTRTAFGQETWDLGGTPLYRGYDGRIYNANVFPPSAPLRAVTYFVDGVTVVDRKTGITLTGRIDLRPTLVRIDSGITSSVGRNDGTVFHNREGFLPARPSGYYTECVHPTPGVTGPGPQRIVRGKGGEFFYTPDHYGTFIPLNQDTTSAKFSIF